MRGARLAVCVAVLAAVEAPAQVPLLTRLSTAQNPRGTQWWQLDTERFRVIYPDSLAHEAPRVAAMAERSLGAVTRSLGVRPERIPLVLNGASLTSNAYVGWSPRRTQWYPMPNTTVEGLGPVDWYRLLAAHEGRHIAQERAVRTGWIGLLSHVFGENTTAYLGGTLYFPSWWWEGDAVGLETATTPSGRGRLPSFTARTRAMLADSMPYAYYPAWQGSYRTALPDWYELGYVLTTYVRRHHGDSAWRRIVQRAARNVLPPYALSMALKRQTGKTLVETHRAAVGELDSLWTRQRAGLRLTEATPRSPAAEAYQSWALPQYAADGSIIALYSDLNTLPQLVRLRAGAREVLVPRVGLLGDLQFHVSGSRAVWAEYEVDPRFSERNFLVVKRLDLETGRVTRLTDRSRYFGPSLSPDGRRIAAIHFSETRRAAIVVLDAESGRELQRGYAPTTAFLVTPVWATDGRSLYVVEVDRERGNALLQVSLEGEVLRRLIDFTYEPIQRPMPAGQHILFSSPRSGLDNIWAVDTLTLAQYQVTSRPFGALHPAPHRSAHRVLFADYGPDGQRVAEASLDRTQWVPAAEAPAASLMYAAPILDQERRLESADTLTRNDAALGAPRPYRGWSRLLDFHSLSLAPTSDGINSGLALESRNLLNTVAVVVGGTFNTNERTMAAEAGVSYAGLPVMLDVATRVGSRASTYTDTTDADVRYRWRERAVTASARLPLTRIMGLSRQSLTLQVSGSSTRVSDQPVAFRFDNNNGALGSLSYAVAASHLRAGAFRDLSATGLSVTALYRHTPFGSDYTSHVAALRSAATTRVGLPNDALTLDVGIERQRPGNYRFASEVTFPRGFSRRYHDDLTRAGATYQLPLWYPDFALGPLAYIRRVQGGPFADAAWGRNQGRPTVSYGSVGADVTADIALLGTRSTMRAGVRLARRLSGDRRTVAQFLLQLP